MEPQSMNEFKGVVKYWWASVVIGILALILGVWCMFTPDSTLIALTYLFVTLLIVSGIMEIIFASGNRNVLYDWGWTLAGGVIDIIFGLLLMTIPPMVVTIILIYFVGFWIMFRGIWTIGSSTEIRRYKVKGWGWLLTLGILTILFSLLFIISPIFGGLFIIVFVSIALIFYGIYRIYAGFQLKSIKNRIEYKK